MTHRSQKTKIAVVTGSRADYGLLFSPLKALQKHPEFELQIIATGMHLSTEFGNTVTIIERDGFYIDSKVESLLASDTASAVGKSIALGIIGFADVLNRLCPEMMLVLGDRYEIFAAVQVALMHRIPVAHIAGGDLTQGAYDDAIRHSITKMSHLHFTTNKAASQRVIQMGENPKHVYTVGSPGLDLIQNSQLLDKSQLEQQLGCKFQHRNIVITFHPTTLDNTDIHQQCSELFGALDTFDSDLGLIFTKANADNQGRTINQLIETYAAAKPNAMVFTSLGQLNYYSLVALCNAVVGNSSSGLYEAPTLNTPTVNIGERQKGRLCAKSVLHCGIEKQAIQETITKALRMDATNVENPYGDSNATPRILHVLESFIDPEKRHALIKKRFFEGDNTFVENKNSFAC